MIPASAFPFQPSTFILQEKKYYSWTEMWFTGTNSSFAAALNLVCVICGHDLKRIAIVWERYCLYFHLIAWCSWPFLFVLSFLMWTWNIGSHFFLSIVGDFYRIWLSRKYTWIWWPLMWPLSFIFSDTYIVAAQNYVMCFISFWKW